MLLQRPHTPVPAWVAGLAPLAGIAALVGLFLVLNPIPSLREVPPAEAVAVERTVFTADGIELDIRNDGPDAVTIAQVLVNDAYWTHTVSDRTLGRLEAATVVIPYPWEAGLPVSIALVTSTGVTVEHDVEAAALTPAPDARTLGIYALLGLYIGVLPVAVGLCWLPALRAASDRWLGFFLAFTLGLLAFLVVDTVAEGLEFAALTASALDGPALLAISALTAVVALAALGRALARRTGGAGAAGGPGGLALAYLVATGIGLHNLGEGLAVGAALAAGELALGTFLVLGFALHNTTEGLAIVAPVRRTPGRLPLAHLAGLAAVAGVPTVAGAIGGGLALAPAWSAVAFGAAAGTIAQVMWTIGRGIGRDHPVTSALGAAGFVAGLALMYVTGRFTA